jgi:uncharacterized delta-60 repeat protein
MGRRGFMILLLALSLMAAILTREAYSVTALDGFDPNANGAVWAITPQADGKILIGGTFTLVGGVARNHIARLNADGTLDTDFNPNVNGTVLSAALQADGKILIGGEFTKIGMVIRNNIARLNADGTLDTDFNPDANERVMTIALQADGAILIGGAFTTIGGTTRHSIARLNADGTLDTDFDPNAEGNWVNSITLQADGKILVGGAFTSVGGVPRDNIARLNTDGTLDAAFDTNTDNAVYSVALQADGRILIGGLFASVGGTTRNSIARLHANGALDTDFNPNADGPVSFVAVQSDGKILLGGRFSSVSGETRNNIARLKADGTLDTDFNPNADNDVQSIALQADGKILLGGWFSTIGVTTRNCMARLYADGALDMDLNPNADSSLFSIALQPDGKILIGGGFTTIGGIERNRIARMNPDGTLDPDFHPNLSDRVYSIAVQADGKILVGGEFTDIGGATRNCIARLNADGSLDAGFNPDTACNPADMRERVNVITLQSDGKILVGGRFTSIAGVPRNNIARLNENGTLDADFNPDADRIVEGVAVQPDGKILTWGGFTVIAGVVRNSIARLNGNGSFDGGFDPGTISYNLVGNGSVNSVALQADGRILMGGQFITVAGVTRINIARLNENGTLDADFNPFANNVVYSIALQADGKILLGGDFTTIGGTPIDFTTINGTPRKSVARLNPNGALDTDFHPEVNLGVYPIVVEQDGKILVGGRFINVDGIIRNYVARITNTDAALQELKVSSPSTVTWTRGQAGPEVWRVTFEHSTNGTTWTSLGNGTRIAGGWQLTGLSLSMNESHYIRARGYGTGGLCNGSGSLFESVKLFYPVPALSMPLLTGWNFISLPVQPVPNVAGNVFASISSALAVAWGYNNGTKAWLRYRPGDAESALTTIDSGKGYWLYLTSPATLIVETGTSASQSISLSAGWNLAGYAGRDGRNLTDALSGISGKWSLIWGWGGGDWSAAQEGQGSLSVPSLLKLYQGRAYWLRVKPGMATSWNQ